MKKPIKTIGWREWAALPELGIPALKIKVDTGARSSCLHASKIEEFERDGKPWVRFWLKPLRQLKVKEICCEAPIIDHRDVTDSGGKRSNRVFIETMLKMGEDEWKIELTLNNRRSMKFRMLLGRTAMEGRLAVDPNTSFTLGRMPYAQLVAYYPEVEKPKA
jgi:hypothetical protein